MVLLRPVDIKSDGGNLLSMFASQDLNPTLARSRISSSSFTKNAGIISARRIFNLCVSEHFTMICFQDKLKLFLTYSFTIVMLSNFYLKFYDIKGVFIGGVNVTETSTQCSIWIQLPVNFALVISTDI